MSGRRRKRKRCDGGGQCQARIPTKNNRSRACKLWTCKTQPYCWIHTKKHFGVRAIDGQGRTNLHSTIHRTENSRIEIPFDGEISDEQIESGDFRGDKKNGDHDNFYFRVGQDLSFRLNQLNRSILKYTRRCDANKNDCNVQFVYSDNGGDGGDDAKKTVSLMSTREIQDGDMLYLEDEVADLGTTDESDNESDERDEKDGSGVVESGGEENEESTDESSNEEKEIDSSSLDDGLTDEYKQIFVHNGENAGEEGDFEEIDYPSDDSQNETITKRYFFGDVLTDEEDNDEEEEDEEDGEEEEEKKEEISDFKSELEDVRNDVRNEYKQVFVNESIQNDFGEIDYPSPSEYELHNSDGERKSDMSDEYEEDEPEPVVSEPEPELVVSESVVSESEPESEHESEPELEPENEKEIKEIKKIKNTLLKKAQKSKKASKEKITDAIFDFTQREFAKVKFRPDNNGFMIDDNYFELVAGANEIQIFENKYKKKRRTKYRTLRIQETKFGNEIDSRTQEVFELSNLATFKRFNNARYIAVEQEVGMLDPAKLSISEKVIIFEMIYKQLLYLHDQKIYYLDLRHLKLFAFKRGKEFIVAIRDHIPTLKKTKIKEHTYKIDKNGQHVETIFGKHIKIRDHAEMLKILNICAGEFFAQLLTAGMSVQSIKKIKGIPSNIPYSSAANAFLAALTSNDTSRKSVWKKFRKFKRSVILKLPQSPSQPLQSLSQQPQSSSQPRQSPLQIKIYQKTIATFSGTGFSNGWDSEEKNNWANIHHYIPDETKQQVLVNLRTNQNLFYEKIHNRTEQIKQRSLQLQEKWNKCFGVNKVIQKNQYHIYKYPIVPFSSILPNVGLKTILDVLNTVRIIVKKAWMENKLLLIALEPQTISFFMGQDNRPQTRIVGLEKLIQNQVKFLPQYFYDKKWNSRTCVFIIVFIFAMTLLNCLPRKPQTATAFDVHIEEINKSESRQEWHAEIDKRFDCMYLAKLLNERMELDESQKIPEAIMNALCDFVTASTNSPTNPGDMWADHEFKTLRNSVKNYYMSM